MDGLLVVAVIVGIALSTLWFSFSVLAVWLWPGFFFPPRKLAAGWLVYAAGMGAATAMTVSSTLLGPAVQALAVGTAALVAFGVLGLRHRNAWVFFAFLGGLSFVSVGGG